MSDPALVAFVRAQANRVAPEQLRAHLIKEGWDPEAVDGAFQEVYQQDPAAVGASDDKPLFPDRIPRLTFAAALAVTAALQALAGRFLEGFLATVPIVLLGLGLMAVSVPRIHDLGRTGWWALMIFVPPFNLALLLGLVARPGEDGDNDFGAAPSVRGGGGAAWGRIGAVAGSLAVLAWCFLLPSGGESPAPEAPVAPQARPATAPPPSQAARAEAGEPASACAGVAVPDVVSAALSEAIKALELRDYARARCLFAPAAAAGNPDALHNIGFMTLEGNGGPADPAAAVELFEKAAEADYEPSATMLASLFERGDRVPKDPRRGATWMLASARLGNPESQAYVGMMYEKGDRLPKDMEKAAKMYLLGARQGYAVAQEKLAECYAFGEGAPKDLPEALKWNILGARGGDADAVENERGLRSLMRPADIAEGERRAAAFRPKRTGIAYEAVVHRN